MSDCLFCGIVRGDIKGEIVYQDNTLVAFKDINPKAPVHLLIVPRRHISTLLDVGLEDKGVIGDIFHLAARLARDQGISKDGFRLVVNCGPAAGQSVYHIHFHLLGGRSFTWPPG
ncbi:MAG: histidine triad nucleotide-binding protein [Deltaproteobacteria bacterium]|jgi:histidine triad (HIT) family protein|nr:histidine triad nucleotide-binding protein [Deltaproteobacteria bacterium]